MCLLCVRCLNPLWFTWICKAQFQSRVAFWPLCAQLGLLQIVVDNYKCVILTFVLIFGSCDCGYPSIIIIPHHTIVAGYYGFTLDVRVSVRRTYVHPSGCFSFPDDNFSKHQWIFTKLGMCIDIVEIWFGIANGQISSNFYSYLSETRPYFRFRTITWVNNKGFQPNLLYTLTLRRCGLGLLMGKFRWIFKSYLPQTRPYFRFQTITWVNNKRF